MATEHTFNINESISSVNSEDAEKYIDEIYNEINQSDDHELTFDNVCKAVQQNLRSEIQRFVLDTVTRNVKNITLDNTRLEFENVTLKEKVESQEKEIQLLRDELISRRNKYCPSSKGNEIFNSKENLSQTFGLIDFDFDTPNTSFHETEIGKETVTKINDQLKEVRSSKHNDFITKSNHKKIIERAKETLNNSTKSENPKSDKKEQNVVSEKKQSKNVIVCGDRVF